MPPCAWPSAPPRGLAARIDEILARQRATLDAGDQAAFVEADRDFHRTIVESAGNTILARLYDQLRDRLRRMSATAIARDPAVAERFLAEHREIVEALEGGGTTTPRAWWRSTWSARGSGSSAPDAEGRFPRHGVPGARQEALASVGRVLSRLATYPSTKVGKFVVVVVWLIAIVALQLVGLQVRGRPEERVVELPAGRRRVNQGARRPRAVRLCRTRPTRWWIFSRADGLTAADRQAVTSFRQSLASDPRLHRRPGPPIFSEDGKAALVITPITVPEGEARSWSTPPTTSRPPRGAAGGLEAEVTARPASRPTRSRSSTRSTGPCSSPPRGWCSCC